MGIDLTDLDIDFYKESWAKVGIKLLLLAVAMGIGFLMFMFDSDNILLVLLMIPLALGGLALAIISLIGLVTAIPNLLVILFTGPVVIPKYLIEDKSMPKLIAIPLGIFLSMLASIPAILIGYFILSFFYQQGPALLNAGGTLLLLALLLSGGTTIIVIIFFL
jgi:hypothetical protein